MAITVTLRNPVANGNPLPATLQAQVAAYETGLLNVFYILVDEGDGSCTKPPITATLNNGNGLWEAPSGTFPIVGHVYTVVVMVTVSSNTGVITDTGSDSKIRCPKTP